VASSVLEVYFFTYSGLHLPFSSVDIIVYFREKLVVLTNPESVLLTLFAVKCCIVLFYSTSIFHFAPDVMPQFYLCICHYY